MGVLEAETIDNAWVSEAVVNFLRGPLYTHPLMSFIDESCLVFTPEEENKFQYSEVHDKFKELVDELLTMFLAELGLSGEEFFDQVSKAQDQLSGFVVSTILTVDDFLMFKAMMVKRNLDLTNLWPAERRPWSASPHACPASVRRCTAAAVHTGAASCRLCEGPTAWPCRAACQHRSEARWIGASNARRAPPQALQVSRTLGESDGKRRELQQALRLLQLEDEDVAMAAALAASLKDCAAADTELADINQAIALSLALDAELRRMQLEQQHAGATAPETRQDELAASRNRLFGRWLSGHPDDAALKPLFALPLNLRPLSQLPFEAPQAVEQLLAARQVAGGGDASRIVTSIDLDIQHALERQISRYVAHNASHGVHNAAALLIDTRDMGVKALVAAQRMEREAETAAYKQQQQQQPRQAQKGAKLGMGSAAAAAAATSLETDAKRAALRDRLAQGLKQSLMAPAVPQ
ncbi:MAG: hypothetical protein WDW38_009819 [Sanguina aurantia]